jgi:hypothetical protein
MNVFMNTFKTSSSSYSNTSESIRIRIRIHCEVFTPCLVHMHICSHTYILKYMKRAIQGMIALLGHLKATQSFCHFVMKCIIQYWAKLYSNHNNMPKISSRNLFNMYHLIQRYIVGWQIDQIIAHISALGSSSLWPNKPLSPHQICWEFLHVDRDILKSKIQ